jgi:hypothetical protein
MGAMSPVRPCRIVAVLALAACAACGSRTVLPAGARDGGGNGFADGPSGSEGDASTRIGDDATGSVDGAPDAQICGTRPPANHRAAEGPACPHDRAPGGVPAMCVVDGGPPPAGDCQQDSDCTAGINGRCLPVRGCYMACSYDGCFSDSDCAGNVPCHCRDSTSSTNANCCLVNSDCRIDDDCGPGGYCSPSQLEGCMRMCTVPCSPGTHCYAGTTEVPCWCGQSCGAGYFCHTADDACTNDCECTEADSACTHQPTGGWACIPCAMVP